MQMTVIGSGVMGSGIAQVLAVSGLRVSLYDVDPAALHRARTIIEDGAFGMRASIQRGKLSMEDFELARARVRYCTDLGEACAAAECAIEAIPEDLPAKLKLFRQLDVLAPKEAILTTNTAGLPIAAMAYATTRPQAVLGWHWAQPCIVIRLAEIIVHQETSPAAVAQVVQLARRCGKNPHVIKDQPREWGFVVNRIMLKVRQEAQKIVDEGVATPEQVDALMKDCFRWPVGIFEALQTLKQ
ncbi:MAG TPA: 3-hydroxyacyl-CoA dehydrogenase family protein [Steroidobacteraceae bacterium]|nr:3-hydroxyacyl-CoA dehydrogenase family protein [Steroidobacteraceae bacterium]